MKKIEEQFVTKEIATSLKELGFDEECFGYFYPDEVCLFTQYEDSNISVGRNSECTKDTVTAPTWEQAIDWFEDNQEIIIEIRHATHDGVMHDISFREENARISDIQVVFLSYIQGIFSFNKYSQLGLFDILNGKLGYSKTKYDCLEQSILFAINFIKTK